MDNIYEKISSTEFALAMIKKAVPAGESKNNQIFKNMVDLKLETPWNERESKLQRMTLEHISDIASALIFSEATDPHIEGKGIEPFRDLRGIISVYGHDLDKIPPIDELVKKFRLTYLEGNGYTRFLDGKIRKVRSLDGSKLTRDIINDKPQFWGIHILSDLGFQMNVKDDIWMDTNTLLGGDYGRKK